jgi:3-phosphoshikimate 1-carboxyvinyltransferase
MTDVTVRKNENLKGDICAPPSKAYTQRMLIAASLSKGTSKLSNPLVSEDTEATLRAVKALGAKIQENENCWTIEGANPIKGSKKPIDCGESAATLRFMIPVAALAPEPSVFALGKGLAKRPIDPLLDSLKQLFVKAYSQKDGRKVSICVEGGGIRGGRTSMPGDISSQFVSGLMFACPLANGDTQLTLTSPLESKSYVLMTENVLSKHGIKVDISEDFNRLKIPSKQTYAPVDSKVPGDFSSAAFLLAAAAITKSEVHVKNLDYGTIQGDKAIMRILKQMGVNGKVCENEIEIDGNGELLTSIDIDASDVPDLVPVCTALACYAKGTSKIHDAERVRLKESDRLLSLFTELRKMGADITMDESSLTVNGPCSLHGAIIDTHNDHRIAMACAVAALRAEGETVIQNAECVRKSYPLFFNDLRRIGVEVVGGELVR